jgi:hypothetical protein
MNKRSNSPAVVSIADCNAGAAAASENGTAGMAMTVVDCLTSVKMQWRVRSLMLARDM